MDNQNVSTLRAPGAKVSEAFRKRRVRVSITFEEHSRVYHWVTDRGAIRLSRG